MGDKEKYAASIKYIRTKVDQLLTLMGTLPLRPEELDDETLLELDPIGIVADSFNQVLQHLRDTNHELALARNEIRTILDAMGAAVVVLNKGGTVADCNRQALDWFFHKEDSSMVIGTDLDKSCSCGSDIESTLIEQRKNEGVFVHEGRHFHVICSDIPDHQGRADKKVFLYFDITPQKQAETELQLYARIFENTAEGIAITDAQMNFLQVNEAFCHITGYSESELIGRKPKTMKSGRHDEAFYQAMWESINENGFWQGEVIDRTKDGGLLPLLQTISVVRNERGEVSNYISIINDITSLKETQTRLDYLAHHDPLTELPNRLLFTDRLEHAIARARRVDDKFALLFIDLDRFKTINDSLGHQIGDRFLIEVAKRLKGLVRRADTVSRLGGDEFVVLLEQLHNDEEADQLALKIVKALKLPFTVNDIELHIGCSIGITFFPDDGNDAVSLLKNADSAMYQVKESGRDGYRRFSQELSEAAHEKLTLENALRHAVRRKQFTLHFQPIIDLHKQRIVAAEALIRWPHPTLGLVAPDKFIPLAEETKLIIPIGSWVAEQALLQLTAWRSAGIELDHISVNASGLQVFHPNFADDLIGKLRDIGVEGDSLQIELTENTLMRDAATCRNIFERLRRHGIRIAIDDFGTGYSSLAYLKLLPIDDLKIDRSFVKDIPGDSNDCAIAEAIIGLAQTLGLQTVAEGIETLEQENYLTSIGCGKVQGYHYAKPMPAAEFAAFYLGYSPPLSA